MFGWREHVHLDVLLLDCISLEDLGLSGLPLPIPRLSLAASLCPEILYRALQSCYLVPNGRVELRLIPRGECRSTRQLRMLYGDMFQASLSSPIEHVDCLLDICFKDEVNESVRRRSVGRLRDWSGLMCDLMGAGEIVLYPGGVACVLPQIVI